MNAQEIEGFAQTIVGDYFYSTPEPYTQPLLKALQNGREYRSRVPWPFANQAHGAYVGPLAHLYGKMALLLDHHPYKKANGARRGYVFAQFDDMHARRRSDRLGFRWHKFRETDFKLKENDQ